MKSQSYIRFIVLVGLAWLGTEYLMETEPGEWAILKYPFAGIFLGIVFLFALAIEASVSSLKNILYMSLSEEAQKKYDEAQEARKSEIPVKIEAFLQSMTKSKEVEEEHEIILDHNYDGIRELDNKLPPWWIWGFYATIVFAVVYLIRFEVIGDYSQAEEYLAEVSEADKEIEAYLATVENIIDYETVVALEDERDIASGENVYVTNCVACHRVDGGGGIGPNLTDKHWILGGGIKNVFKTISEGGRPAKGMVSWKSDLSAKEMQQVASYVLTLQENNPADGKAPEGEIWEEEKTEEDNTEEDSAEKEKKEEIKTEEVKAE
jgi:cytochrome c oxidase cbb3-type subunit 3